LKKISSGYLDGFFHQMKSERLVCLRPRQRGVGIGNITLLLQEVKFRTLSVGGSRREGAIEVVNLSGEAIFVGGIGEKALATNDGKQRIENASLRFAVGLQKGVTKIQAIAAHLAGRKPLIVILEEQGISGVPLDAVRAFQPRWYQFQDGVLHGPRSNAVQGIQQKQQRGTTRRSGGASKGSVVARRSVPF
jgi:hypothetical protein